MLEKSQGGRPSKFTPERVKQIIDYIFAGVPYELAARSSGVSERILYLWIAQGERETDQELETPHAKFFQSLSTNIAHKIIDNMTHIQQGSKSWQANAWILNNSPLFRKYFGNDAIMIEKLTASLELISARLNAMENKQYSGSRVADSESSATSLRVSPSAMTQGK